jgi:hypothetical protein
MPVIPETVRVINRKIVAQAGWAKSKTLSPKEPEQKGLKAWFE